MNVENDKHVGQAALVLRTSAETDDEAPAWEMVGAGRYKPRRIRGSFRGGELG